jgi:NAD(P)-dependent dehydrogenase (short-subunit alcohol dehydrogenase family)
MNYRNLFDLTGRNALVVGGGSGIGEGVCHGYADFGANVAVFDLDQSAAQRVSCALKEKGSDSIAIQCDVRDSENVRHAVEIAAEHYASFDILFNSAGIGRRHSLEDMPDDFFDSVMKTNLYGVFYFCREVGIRMIQHGRGGRIINMASISAHIGIPFTANYCASKSGVIGFSRCLATEWACHGINVNAISPSHIRTDMIQKVIDEDPSKETFFQNNILLGRIGEVADIVGAAIFLASDAGNFITGTSLIVDGGHSAR